MFAKKTENKSRKCEDVYRSSTCVMFSSINMSKGFVELTHWRGAKPVSVDVVQEQRGDNMAPRSATRAYQVQ